MWALWYGNEEAATLAVGTGWALFVFLPHPAFKPLFFFLSPGDMHVNTVSKGRCVLICVVNSILS